MTAPRISVIIPVHNRAGLVGQAIDSVLGQSFADFELVVVDDGSSDGSDAAVAACADPRVRLAQGVTPRSPRAILEEAPAE